MHVHATVAIKKYIINTVLHIVVVTIIIYTYK